MAILHGVLESSFLLITFEHVAKLAWPARSEGNPGNPSIVLPLLCR